MKGALREQTENLQDLPEEFQKVQERVLRDGKGST